MADGYILVEGMRTGARLTGLPLTLKGIVRYPVPTHGPEQPAVWTSVEFSFAEEDAERLAAALADVLEPHGGWYTDFTAGGETFVVYADRIFRYPAGDESGRAEAVAYGTAAGVPEHQLDWAD